MKTRIFDVTRQEWVKEFMILGDSAYRIIRDSHGAFASGDMIDGEIEYGMDKEDKHGTEIYEGDNLVIEPDCYYGERKGEASFSRGTFTVGNIEFWDDGEHEWYGVENMCEDEVEIVGNIHGVKYEE